MRSICSREKWSSRRRTIVSDGATGTIAVVAGLRGFGRCTGFLFFGICLLRSNLGAGKLGLNRAQEMASLGLRGLECGPIFWRELRIVVHLVRLTELAGCKGYLQHFTG